ncbi:UNVERIFIED_CONTAM: hypothetical protein K2H54_039026 [Gekko kuhli]
MHLSALVNHTIIPPDKPTNAAEGLTKEVWSKYQKDKKVDEEMMLQYKKVMAEWKACEMIVKLREKESQTVTKFSSGSSIDSHVQRLIHRDSTISNDVFVSAEEMDSVEQEPKVPVDPALVGAGVDVPTVVAVLEQQPSVEFDSPDSGLPSSRNYSVTSGILSSIDDGQSVCFEEGMEEDPGTDPQRPGAEPAQRTKSSASEGSVAEESLCSLVDSKLPVEETLSVCSAAYTVRS